MINRHAADAQGAGRRIGPIVIRMLLAFVLMQAVFMILLVSAYSIPSKMIVDNVRDARLVFDEQTTWEWMIPGAQSTREDNYTDGLMLGEAVFEGTGNTIQDAFRNSYPRGEDTDVKYYPDYWVVRYVEGDHDCGSVDYWRYWHGYLVLLKPLLIVLNYQGILLLLGLIESLLMLVLVTESYRRFGIITCASVTTVLFLMTPSAISLSLQLSWVFLIMLVSSMVVIYQYRLIDENQLWGVTFLVFGGLTSYLDLLTFPTITLSMPLFFLLLGRSQANKSISISKILPVCLSWAVGYGGTWSFKWLATSIILRENCFPLERLMTRSSSEAYGEVITYLDVLGKNVSAYNNAVYPLVLILLAILALLVWRGRSAAVDWQCVPAYLLVALIPFVWLFATKNHAFIHYWMTYRNLSVVPAAFVMMGTAMFGMLRDSNNKDDCFGRQFRA